MTADIAKKALAKQEPPTQDLIDELLCCVAADLKPTFEPLTNPAPYFPNSAVRTDCSILIFAMTEPRDGVDQLIRRFKVRFEARIPI